MHTDLQDLDARAAVVFTPTMESLHALTAEKFEAIAIRDSMRFLSCVALAGTTGAAVDRFLAKYDESPFVTEVRNLGRKAATPPGVTTTITWAGGLLPPALLDPLMKRIQTASVLARAGLIAVPPNVPTPLESAAPSLAWVAQNTPKPVTQIAFDAPALRLFKFGGIITLALELVRSTGPGVEAVMSGSLIAAATAFLDRQFLDPALAAVADKNPASVTNGKAPITATGNLAKDVATLLGALYTARPTTQRPVLIMTPATAGALASSGAAPDLRVDGGYAFGVPVAPTVGATNHVIALDAAGIVYTDGGGEIDISREAAIAIDAATPAVLTDLWGNNLVGFRVERFANWFAQANAVQVLTLS